MLTRRLLSFSREQALDPRPVDVRVLLDGMRDLLERTVSEAIEMRIHVQRDLWACQADPAQLETALLNLAINSRDAMSAGGELVLEASNVHFDERKHAQEADALSGAYVAITVRDTGDGIDDAILDRVFDPFFTTKEVGAGSGLGLSMVYGFAKQSGGYVSISSVRGEGTEVRLCLPATDLPVDSSESETADAVPMGNGERVLVVEDEPTVRKLMVTLLENLGYEPVAAEDAHEALEILDRGEPFDLLLSDVVLPGETSGLNFGIEFVRRRPGARVLFMSGYAPDNVAYPPALRETIVLLHKPFRKLELAYKLREVLSSEPADASDSE
jgi:CheY-like chemotaxis protein